VVDAQGNAVALIHSLYSIFGSGIVAGGTGIVLQNRSAYFSLDPRHPNHLEARKRPMHTLIASMAFEGGKLRHVFGCMGADGQPQIHLQGYVGLIDFGRNVQEAVSAPRWLLGRTWGEESTNLKMEERFAPEIVDALRVRGHDIEVLGPFEEVMGHAGAVVRHTDGLLEGAFDPRSDGTAAAV
jgi:gamma-glutamyltranspeptidase/glutathione hydrolase